MIQLRRSLGVERSTLIPTCATPEIVGSAGWRAGLNDGSASVIAEPSRARTNYVLRCASCGRHQMGIASSGPVDRTSRLPGEVTTVDAGLRSVIGLHATSTSVNLSVILGGDSYCHRGSRCPHRRLCACATVGGDPPVGNGGRTRCRPCMANRSRCRVDIALSSVEVAPSRDRRRHQISLARAWTIFDTGHRVATVDVCVTPSSLGCRPSASTL